MQPTSVDDYCYSQDSVSDTSSDGEVKGITIMFMFCL